MKRIVLLMVLMGSVAAHAQNCERRADTSPQGVAGLSDAARLEFLSKLLLEESARAHNWVLAWGGIYAGLGMAQLALMPLFPAEEQPDWYWGAASTGVGLAFTLLGRPEVLEAGPLYGQRVSAATPENTCALIAEGERLLQTGAETEEASFKWYLHAGNVLFNIGMALVLGLGYGHWRGGLINLGVGIVMGGANILSGPAHLISGWKHYAKGQSPQAVTFHVVPTAGPGLGVLLRF